MNVVVITTPGIEVGDSVTPGPGVRMTVVSGFEVGDSETPGPGVGTMVAPGDDVIGIVDTGGTELGVMIVVEGPKLGIGEII